MKSRLLYGIIVILIILNIYMMKISRNKEIQLLYNEDNLAQLLLEVHPAIVMVDLRDKKDYEEGHIEGFINIPSKEGVELLKYLQKNKLEKKSIYLMCYTGKRAAAATNLLQKKGFTHLTYITFGYDDFANSQKGFVPQKGECDCLAK
jgi:Rhodanese-related sulfurtransferase